MNSSKKRCRSENSDAKISQNVNLDLDDREEQLEQREEALHNALERLAEEKKLMTGRKLSDVLSLNIGGTKCHACRRTLCLYEPSMLATHFSGRWDDNVEKDSDGCFFIDQPYELFKPLLDYLRDKAIESLDMPVPPPVRGKLLPNGEMSTDEISVKRFDRMVEHYGMTPFVYPQRFVLWRGTPIETPNICNANLSINSKEWATYILESVGHLRRLDSFTVVTDSTLNFGAGWAEIRRFRSCKKTSSYGVGDLASSVALRGRIRCGIYYNEILIKSLDQVSLQKDTVVTCEHDEYRFRWLVDGTEVAIILKSLLNEYDCCDMMESEFIRPAITGKGKWHLSEFSYVCD